MDLTVFLGAGAAPIIERVVQFLRVQFRLNSFVASLLVLPFAIAVNYGLGSLYHYGVDQMGLAVAATLFSVWGVHEVSK